MRYSKLRPPYLSFLALLLAAAAFLFRGGATVHVQADPCAGLKPVACENLKTGNPAGEWDVSGAGDTSIQGFATDISVDQGQTVRFKVRTDASAYRLDIYRLGYYGGLGARKVASLLPSASLPQAQPACLSVPASGLIDCGNWAQSASWSVPSDAVSGIYIARAVRTDTGGASHIVFIVRDDDGRSDVLFQTSDTTWQAYNSYGGNSLYVGAPAGRAYEVSYNRPFNTRGTSGGPSHSWVFNAEYPMVRWLEANGYDVSYFTGVDTDRRGLELQDHRVFLSVGHDEYWSATQRTQVEMARDAGVHLAFFSGNEVFWKTRWAPSIDGSGTPYRTLVSYKETHANAKIDPTPEWTGTWRDPRFSPPADGGRPENALTGTIFMVNGTRNDAITVPEAEGKMRFWRNTSIANLAPGTTATLPTGTLGYEWDEDLDNGFRPAGLFRLSSTTLNVTPLYLLDYGSTYGSGVATHNLTLYRHTSGALVFGAGTVQWSWGLDAMHDNVGGAADVRMQQATVNLFADMGVQPGSLQPGLTAATASFDLSPPSSTITSPLAGASVSSGAPITVTGTAADGGGGIVAAVEVSDDGGVSWRAASGRESWQYVWTPSGPGGQQGSAALVSRAIDDSGNIGSPSESVIVTIEPIGGLAAAYSFDEGGGSSVADTSGNVNHGAISGATWNGSGRFGAALSFDGVNDWVTVNDAASLDLTNGMTLEAWVRPTTLSGWRTAMMKEATGGLAYALYAHDNLPWPAGYVHTTFDWSVSGTSAILLNTWTHLATTYDGATLRLYVNGIEVQTRAISGNIAVSSFPLRIGGNATWGEYFQGLIDDVRVYRRALSSAEVRADLETPVTPPAPDTTPPSVSLTSPVPGSTVGGTISVSADAADNVGVVGVQFLLDGSPLGVEDTVPPYSISWITTTAANGSHTLSARARDAAGNTALAPGVTVTVSNVVDTTPPTVSVTEPAAGSTVSGTTTVSASASDNNTVAGVQFLVDGTPIGAEDVTAPYSVSWDTRTVGNASHSLAARARDANGNQTTSAGVPVTVSNSATLPGLVAAFGFDEGTGSTTADASGNGNVGTISGAAWTPAGRFGQALSFDGTNDWVTVADSASLDLTTGMTVEAWVRPTTLTGWRTVLLKERSGGLAYSLYAHNNDPNPAVTIHRATQPIEDWVSGAGPLALNAWTHLAGTYDGTTLRLYVNAQQVSSRLLSGAMFTSTDPLRIGGNAPWGEYYSGLLDEVRLYNRALSQAELQSDMNTAVGLGPPNQVGQWSAPVAWPLVAVHMMLLRTGEVLTWDGPPINGGQSARLWNPATGSFTSVPNNTTDLFCVSHSALPDGRMLVLGGHAGSYVGLPDANIFDPGTRAWTPVAPMAFPRWYPTSTSLPDGRVLVTSGAMTCETCIAEVPEIYNPTTNTWTQLASASLSLPPYPYMFVLPDGRVLNVGSNEGTVPTRALDLGTGTWSMIDAAPLPAGSAAMYLPGKIMKSGSSRVEPFLPSLATTYVIDMTGPSPQWRQTASMAFPRTFHNSTVLPDGTVLVTGGSQSTGSEVALAVYEPELWSPATETWTRLAPMQVPRMYHSNALLLPDGRVLVAGSGRLQGPDQLSSEIYSPPYLFKGARPTITSAPATLGLGSQFFVGTPDQATIASVSLIRLGSVTHTFDEDQRFVPLTFQQGTGGINVQAPANANLAPPGYYMLFVVNASGVPSIAPIVRVEPGAGDVQPPTAPTSLTATGAIGSVGLNWNAATDNTGVVGYNVHRSTVTGFTPTTGNRIAQPVSTAYTDPGLAAGTYYYVVTARDAAGNVSGPSNQAAATVTGDTSAPTVSITSPAAGAVVSATIGVTAAASDNVAVLGVQFLLDGAPIGAEDTSAPYSVNWDTRTTTNGAHDLSARARDAAGNQATSTAVAVTVSNAAPGGAVAAYGFSETTGTTTADATGKGHTGTISGATRTASGRNGYALSFDGVNDWVTVSDAADLDLTSGMTLEAWVRPSSLSGWRTVVMKQNSAGLAYGLYANDNDPWPALTVSIAGADRSSVGTAQLLLNTWTHVAGTYDGATLRLYVNGVQVRSVPQTGSMAVTTGVLRIGGNSVWGEYFAGLIDEVRVYDRALSEAEIQTDMNTPVN